LDKNHITSQTMGDPICINTHEPALNTSNTMKTKQDCFVITAYTSIEDK
jgi:hypothetical protein